MEGHRGGVSKVLYICRGSVCTYKSWIVNFLSSFELVRLVYSLCGTWPTCSMTSLMVLLVGLECYSSSPLMKKYVRLSPDNESASVDQLYHDLSSLTSLLFLPAPGCWHMVCVPQCIHWRLSRAGTRDQGRAHPPGNFLQQPRALQL